MKRIETGIPGLVVLEPKVYADDRGFFMETWNLKRYGALGLGEAFVQSNLSYSRGGVIRGLHYQHPRGQGKLVQVLSGRVFDVAVDIRSGSPTRLKWAGVELSEDNHRQLWVPAGFAHGFCVLGEAALLMYWCTDEFVAGDDGAVAWNDPQIGISWPIEPEAMSDKDRNAPPLAAIDSDRLPRFHP